MWKSKDSRKNQRNVIATRKQKKHSIPSDVPSDVSSIKKWKRDNHHDSSSHIDQNSHHDTSLNLNLEKSKSSSRFHDLAPDLIEDKNNDNDDYYSNYPNNDNNSNDDEYYADDNNSDDDKYYADDNNNSNDNNHYEKENEDDNSYTTITIDNDTLSSRFTEFLLRHLLKNTDAKDKNVRFRVCQLIALIINSIGTIEWVKISICY